MDLEKQKTEWIRKGAIDKAKFVEKLDTTILASQVKRIQQNDKSVLKEMVLPKWVDWDLLYTWANSKTVLSEKGRRCILCNEAQENGIPFNEKFICENCFIKLKHADLPGIENTN